MNMCPSYKRKSPPESCLKGQVFFIWSSPQALQIASEKIALLGGRIETFLSKQITSIIVESAYAVAAHQFCNDLSFRASYAQNAIVASNFSHPGVLCNLPSTSRGYKFLAATNTSAYDNIFLFSRQWGIGIIELNNFLSSIEPFVKAISTINHSAKKNQNISNLTGCFIKFECFHKKFRPCYKMFSSDPERLMPLRNANVLIKAEHCNVILDIPTGPRQLHPNHMDLNQLQYRAQDSKPPVKDKKFPKLKPKEENNYCECCRTHFNDLKTHIKSANHQKFVSNEKNYESVNNILKMLPSPQEFIQKHQNPEQASNLVLFNGDMMHSKNASFMADLPIPLNLHLKKSESPLPLNLHDKHAEEVVLPLNLHVKKDESPSPLNLHVNQNEEIKQESPATRMEPSPLAHMEPSPLARMEPSPLAQMKPSPSARMEPSPLAHMKPSPLARMEPSPLARMEPSPLGNDNSVKSEIDVVGIKPDSPPDDDCKDLCLPEVPNELLLESCGVDPLLDKTNTATLAQLCIKNFENCWMENIDNLPDDMDDMMFDDNIFDFDDCKSKGDENESPDLEGDFSPAMNSPAFVSGISTDLKTQPNTNTSVIVNSSIDLKDSHVKVEEAVNSLEAFSPISKADIKYSKPLSPPNLGINDKMNLNKNFDMKSSASPFYVDKPNMNMSPSCSNPIPVKLSEQMFSSESSDDENENLISNALHMINSNSDNEMKTDKDNFEDAISKSILQHEKCNISASNLGQSCTSNIEMNDLKNSGHSPISNMEARNAIHSEISSVNSPAFSFVPSPAVDVAASNRNNEVTCSASPRVPCSNYSEMITESPAERVSVGSVISNPIISAPISDRSRQLNSPAENSVISVDLSKVVNRNPSERIIIANPLINTDLSTQCTREVAGIDSNVMPLDFSKVIDRNSSKRIGASIITNTVKNVNPIIKEMPIDFSKVISQNSVKRIGASLHPSHMGDQSVKDMAFVNNDRNTKEFERVMTQNVLERTSSSTSNYSDQNHPVPDVNYLEMMQRIRHPLSSIMVTDDIRNSAFSNVSSLSLSDGINSPVATKNAVPRRDMIANSSTDNLERTLTVPRRDMTTNSSTDNLERILAVPRRDMAANSSTDNLERTLVAPRRDMTANSSTDNLERTLTKTNEGVCVKADPIPSENLNKDLSCSKVCYPLQTQTSDTMPGYICNTPQQTCMETVKLMPVRNSLHVRNGASKGNVQSVSANKRNSDGVRQKDSLCDYIKGKNNQSSERMSCISSKRDGRTKKETLTVQSHTPYTKAQSFSDTPKTKIPHKKTARKLRKLPSLWSVSILPGKGLKLKFTCLQPESLASVETDEEGAQPVKHRGCQ